MSSKKTILLDGVKKGQFISQYITTQAANTISVKLYDNQKVYVDKSKASVNIEPPLAQGSAFVQGDGLSIDIASSGDYELRLRHTMSDISSDSGKCVGKSFALAGEDYIDNDFNDVCVSISAWNKARQ